MSVADVGRLVRLDAEQREDHAVLALAGEGDAGEAEEAGRVGAGGEGVEEGGLDQVEVRLGRTLTAGAASPGGRCGVCH